MLILQKLCLSVFVLWTAEFSFTASKCQPFDTGNQIEAAIFGK